LTTESDEGPWRVADIGVAQRGLRALRGSLRPGDMRLVPCQTGAEMKAYPGTVLPQNSYQVSLPIGKAYFLPAGTTES